MIEAAETLVEQLAEYPEKLALLRSDVANLKLQVTNNEERLNILEVTFATEAANDKTLSNQLKRDNYIAEAKADSPEYKTLAAQRDTVNQELTSRVIELRKLEDEFTVAKETLRFYTSLNHATA